MFGDDLMDDFGHKRTVLIIWRSESRAKGFSGFEWLFTVAISGF